MASADLISLGIGSPAGIRAFILFGLSTNAGASDTTPDPLDGETKSGQALSTVVTFTAVVPTGYDAATTIALSGAASGEYRINAGAYGTASGTLNPGDSFTVRHTSSASYLTNTDSAITLDGTVTGTYRSVTQGDPSQDVYIHNPFNLNFWRF